MYAYNYGKYPDTKRLVNIFRPTIGHPYQVLDQPGINNPGPRFYGYYVTDDFGNMVILRIGWANSPAYQE